VLVDTAPAILSEIPQARQYPSLPRAARNRDPRRTTSRRSTSEAVLAGRASRRGRSSGLPASASPALATLDFARRARGRNLVDATPRVEGLQDVWALGDRAAVPTSGRPAVSTRRLPARAAPGPPARRT
jgi:hypothetical protein